MDYHHIAMAVDFYKGRGYVYVPDAPWHVGRDAYYATKPVDAVDVSYVENVEGIRRHARDEFLVASGEQSFLQMMLDGQKLKRHVCVTPCYRVERYDNWHLPYFMKVELINAQDTDRSHLYDMVHDAMSFFEKFFSIRTEVIGDSVDIVEKGTRAELGSYGIRERDIGGKRYRWIYGTGCAEPRLSTAIQRHNSQVGR